MVEPKRKRLYPFHGLLQKRIEEERGHYKLSISNNLIKCLGYNNYYTYTAIDQHSIEKESIHQLMVMCFAD